MSTIDHKALALSRLLTQFKESPNLQNYITTILTQSQELEDTICDLLTDRYIDDAIGVQLDIIGEIVGLPRITIPAEALILFGFAPNANANAFGSVTNAALGGRFRSNNEGEFGNRLLTDEEYRVALRAQISKNYTDCSPESIIASMKLIFGVDVVNLVDGDMEYHVQIGKILTQNEKILLIQTDVLPKTAGVQVQYSDFEPNNVFAFSGFITGSGFADENIIDSGGIFASTAE